MFGVAQIKIRQAFLGVSFALLLSVPALGQSSAPNDPSNVAGFTAQENSDAAGIRAPGRMVQAGIGRQQTAIVSPRFGFNITETSFPLNPRQVFLIDAIQIVFNQLNQAIVLFQNALLARAGEPPVIPPSLLPTGTLGTPGTQGTGNTPVTPVNTTGTPGNTTGTPGNTTGTTGAVGDTTATEGQADITTDGQDSSATVGSTPTQGDGRTPTRKVRR